ncbi:MAG TPA: protein-export chaperone SecB [Pseudomonadales bacterium]
MSENSGEAPATGGSGQVRLERMYLKDASFESPNAPAVFQQAWQPEFELSINTRSEQKSSGLYEVVITTTVSASQQGKTAFIVEVQQAGLFRMEGLPDAAVHRALGSFCPNILFPYVRETVDSLAVRGGFPPVQLVPVNFEMAYEEAMRQARESAKSNPPTSH